MSSMALALLLKPLLILPLIMAAALGVYLTKRFASPRWRAVLLRPVWVRQKPGQRHSAGAKKFGYWLGIRWARVQRLIWGGQRSSHIIKRA